MKRVVDVTAAAVLLVVASPILLLAALAILVSMGPPVLYRQERAGRDGAIFTLRKLRTMRPAAPGDGEAGDAVRITRLGRWLRVTSLDELPQLWNVIQGEMSLVGPRPLLPAYLVRYSPWQARRHEVRPGLTGL